MRQRARGRQEGLGAHQLMAHSFKPCAARLAFSQKGRQKDLSVHRGGKTDRPLSRTAMSLLCPVPVLSCHRQLPGRLAGTTAGNRHAAAGGWAAAGGPSTRLHAAADMGAPQPRAAGGGAAGGTGANCEQVSGADEPGPARHPRLHVGWPKLLALIAAAAAAAVTWSPHMRASS